MPPDPTHPEPERLRDFARGLLDEAALAPIAAHLNGCAPCRSALDAFAAADPFPGRLRDAARAPAGRDGDRAELRLAARALLADSRRPAPPTARPPRVVGAYELLAEAGRGGMGVVYRARHRALNRPVALKMILAGEFASEAQLRRFHLEAELAARVRHPNIVQVDAVGAHDGRPYLVMEWVDGGTLADRLDGRPWPAADAARLVETLARAVAEAHQQGVIHRDLKPENILLAPATGPGGADGGAAIGVPKIADFGLARSLRDAAGLTASGLLLGTPGYLAPEAAAGGGAVGPGVDVYSLGVLLCQLLTGSPPFRGDGPIAVLRAAAEAAPAWPRRLRRAIGRDLETVALRAIERDPGRRYPTATALAADLRRYLAGEPVLARPAGLITRLGKWARREPRLAATSLVLLAVSAGSFLGVTSLWFAAVAARDQASAARNVARARADDERWARYRADIAAAASAIALNNAAAARGLLAGSPPEHRDWEWSHLGALLDNARDVARPFAAGRPAQLVASPDGARLAALGPGGRGALAWEVAAGPGGGVPLGGPGGADFRGLAFAPDGSEVATVGADAAVRTWDARTGAARRAFEGLDGPPDRFAYSPDGGRLAGRTSGRLIVWDARDGRPVVVIDRPGGFDGPITFGPGGRRIAAATWRALLSWDAATGAELPTIPAGAGRILAVAFHPDGTRVAVGPEYPDTAVRVFDLATAAAVAELRGHTNSVYAVGFSPDGARLVSASRDQTLRAWWAGDPRPATVLRGHTGLIDRLSFLDDARVVSAAQDNTLRVWGLADGEALAVLRGGLDPIAAVAVAAGRGGGLIATADRLGLVRTWEPAALARAEAFRGHAGFVYGVAFAPDGATVASASWDGTARAWDATTGREVARADHPGSLALAVAFRPDGRQAASLDRAGRVLLWDPATGAVGRTIRVPADPKADSRLAYDPRGGRLAVLDVAAGTVLAFDPATGGPLPPLAAGPGPVTGLAFDPAGDWLATIECGTVVRVRPVGRRDVPGILLPHDRPVADLAFGPDGRLLATSEAGGKVRLWDLAGSAAPATARAVLAQGADPYGLAFNRAGTRLAVGCSDGVTRLWDVARGELVVELRGHTDYVHAVAFSPDGSRLVTGSGDATLRVWDAQPRRQRLAPPPPPPPPPHGPGVTPATPRRRHRHRHRRGAGGEVGPR